jgi:hypothetical protein
MQTFSKEGENSRGFKVFDNRRYFFNKEIGEGGRKSRHYAWSSLLVKSEL